jgi:hypothetical protein
MSFDEGRTSESSTSSSIISLSQEWKGLHAQLIAKRKEFNVWPAAMAQILQLDPRHHYVVELLSRSGREALISANDQSLTNRVFVAVKNHLSESSDPLTYDSSYFNTSPPTDAEEVFLEFSMDNRELLTNYSVSSLSLKNDRLTFVVSLAALSSPDYPASAEKLRETIFTNPFLPIPERFLKMDSEILRSMKFAKPIPLASPTDFGSASMILVKGRQVCISCKHVISETRESVDLKLMPASSVDSSKYRKTMDSNEIIIGRSNDRLIYDNHDVGLVALSSNFNFGPFIAQSPIIPKWADLPLRSLEDNLLGLEVSKHGCSSGVTTGEVIFVR